jgi:hypothetical protein
MAVVVFWLRQRCVGVAGRVIGSFVLFIGIVDDCADDGQTGKSSEKVCRVSIARRSGIG